MSEIELCQEDKETIAFDNWADDTCEHNGFYECNHPKKGNSDGCFYWNCPNRGKFWEIEEYKELQKV